MNRDLRFYQRPLVKRFLACLFLGFVLALMVGKHEGSVDDYSYGFRQAVLGPRIFVFLGIGVLVFLAMTYWPRIAPYAARPGIRPLLVGSITAMAGYGLLKWTDDSRVAQDGKLGTLSGPASQTGGLSPLARTFFTMPVPWLLLLGCIVLGVSAIILHRSALAWATVGLAAVAGLWGYAASGFLDSYMGSANHATGPLVALLGYGTLATAAAISARSELEHADSSNFARRIFAWRPGLVLAALGSAVGLLAVLTATWFAPQTRNTNLAATANLFSDSGLAPLAQQFLRWGVYVVLLVAIVSAVLATLGRRKPLGWAAFGAGLLGLVLTLMTIYSLSGLAADRGVDAATGPWQNLGVGGWYTCLAFAFLAGAGWIVARAGSASAAARAKADVASSDHIGSVRHIPGMREALLIMVMSVALFYPPTMTDYWQKVFVTQIGVYVLLAIGLNVVVGWAGLLDLGFIAFYAIGSYTTAYLVGSLPHKPPEWLHLSPLWAIPFAVALALMAGVMLGAPTLRLRGDYLAIVTMGFGEIIRITAVNNPANITNSTRGPQPPVPHPTIHVGPLQINWGLNNLQYWYLLLVIMIIVIVLFRRLEDSRIGRAWAAIREDEVAAQASGVNTFKAKLLAFAIGASTSGIAGVFFASQVGYFNPDNFKLENSILVVAYVVFGGMGSLPGAIAGAAVLTWLPEFLKEQVPGEDRQMWIGAAILLMMIFRPAGLLPAKRREAELDGIDETPALEPRAVPENESMGAQA